MNSFFDQAFLKDIITALIASGTALLVFFFTIRHDRRKDESKKKEENKNRIIYLLNLVSSSIDHAAVLIKNLQSTIEFFEEDKITFHHMLFSPNSSFVKLHETLKHERYFLAFIERFENNVVKNFNEISLKVDYFKMQEEQIWDSHKSAQMYDYERKKIFKQLSEEAIETLPKFLSKSNIEEMDQKTLDLLIIDFYKKHPQEFDEKISLNYYYSFIRKVMSDILVKYYKDHEINSCLKIIKRASVMYNDIINHNVEYKGDLIAIRESLSNALDEYKRLHTVLLNSDSI